MQHFKTYHSPIYRGFKSIETDDRRAVVRFFEKHEKAIIQLEFNEYFELLIAYTDCLLYTSPSPRDLSTSRMPSSA